MQTRDAVEGLHNCREFSHFPECLDEAMETRKTFSIPFIKIIRQMKETNDGKFLIETYFLDTRSYFLPANQNARLTAYNQSKFV